MSDLGLKVSEEMHRRLVDLWSSNIALETALDITLMWHRKTPIDWEALHNLQVGEKRREQRVMAQMVVKLMEDAILVSPKVPWIKAKKTLVELGTNAQTWWSFRQEKFWKIIASRVNEHEGGLKFKVKGAQRTQLADVLQWFTGEHLGREEAAWPTLVSLDMTEELESAQERSEKTKIHPLGDDVLISLIPNINSSHMLELMLKNRQRSRMFRSFQKEFLYGLERNPHLGEEDEIKCKSIWMMEALKNWAKNSKEAEAVECVMNAHCRGVTWNEAAISAVFESDDVWDKKNWAAAKIKCGPVEEWLSNTESETQKAALWNHPEFKSFWSRMGDAERGMVLNQECSNGMFRLMERTFETCGLSVKDVRKHAWVSLIQNKMFPEEESFAFGGRGVHERIHEVLRNGLLGELDVLEWEMNTTKINEEGADVKMTEDLWEFCERWSFWVQQWRAIKDSDTNIHAPGMVWGGVHHAMKVFSSGDLDILEDVASRIAREEVEIDRIAEWYVQSKKKDANSLGLVMMALNEKYSHLSEYKRIKEKMERADLCSGASVEISTRGRKKTL